MFSFIIPVVVRFVVDIVPGSSSDFSTLMGTVAMAIVGTVAREVRVGDGCLIDGCDVFRS